MLLTSRFGKKVKAAPIRRTDEDVMEDNSVMDVDDTHLQEDGETLNPVDAAELREARKKSKEKSKATRVVPPAECRANLRLLFRNEAVICSLIFGRHGPFELGTIRGPALLPKLGQDGAPMQTENGASADVFFMDVISVAPTRFRPASVMGDATFENPQNELLTKIINTSFRVRDLNRTLTDLAANKNLPGIGPDSTKEEVNAARTAWAKSREQAYESLLGSMIQLQVDVNSFIDSNKNPAPAGQGRLPPPGVKQALEKKEGLFRKHMMVRRYYLKKRHPVLVCRIGFLLSASTSAGQACQLRSTLSHLARCQY